MAISSESRDRVLIVGAALFALACVAVVALVVAVVVRSGAEAEEPWAPTLRQPLVVDDLCAVVQPAVPRALGLSGVQSTHDSGNGTTRATCVVGSSGASVLEVRVTGYKIPEGDPYGMLDQLVATTCDAVEERYGAGLTEDLTGGCSGQDPESTTTWPTLTTATMVTPLPHLDAIVSVALTDRDSPARAAAYASAITYGVAGNLTR